jgi:alcohol dehydrogenase (NADP+)
MLTVSAYAATSATSPLSLTTVQRRAVGSHDVLIRIEFCGVCHSDIHHAHGDWRSEPYPLVPGHEIAGIVTEIGSHVTKHSIGDRVGVGCMVNSCRECVNCRQGEEQYCLTGGTLTYGAIDNDGTITQGGYSSHVVVTEDFVVGIPDGLALDVAAPLLCAGITSYAPLRRRGAGPGKKIAIVGLGGLGHMAVKFAKALGSEVTVLSQSWKKREDALRLGADHFFATSDAGTFEQLANQFDLILNTVSAGIDVDAYLSLLALGGELVNVGAPAEPLSLNVFSMLANRRSFSGSLIGGIRETQEMLNFCSTKQIWPEIEIISFEEINVAFERVLSSDVRYRFVLDNSTLPVPAPLS